MLKTEQRVPSRTSTSCEPLESGRFELDMSQRRIGPIGTSVRVVAGMALLVVALADQPAGLVWGLQSYELALVAFPGLMIASGLLASRLLDRSFRFTGPVGISANLAAIVVLFAIPFTAGAAALFYGTSLLVAGWRGAPHCEATVLSNLILRRDDQIGCPVMTPIDAIEGRHAE
jgi:hypothetical protein